MLPHPPGPIQPRDRSRNTLDSLCNMYGVTSFRPGQLECLQAFSEGKDVWAQLPCGGGKTLVFIMSLLLHCTAEVGAIGILVQPLLSIRRGVVAKLENHGIEAITLDSSTSARVCNLLQSGRPTHPIVIVTSPEAITNNDAVLASLKQPAPPVGGQANCVKSTPGCPGRLLVLKVRPNNTRT
jgi:superfamily II DNA helicase RecQ